MELQFEELFELELEDELELEFEELLELELEDEFELRFEDELDDEFELELPATRVGGVSPVAAALPAALSATVSSGGVAACAVPTASAAVAKPARVVILTVRFMRAFSLLTQAAPR